MPNKMHNYDSCKETSNLMPFEDFKVISEEGIGCGVVGDSSNRNLRRSEDRTTFISSIANR